MNIDHKMQVKVLDWIMTSDNVGESSQDMASAAVGIKRGNSHPHDPSDLYRCIKLLREVPEIRNHFDKVAKLSKVWSKLIDRWDELESLFINEVGYDGELKRSAPDTYKRIEEIIR